MRYVLQFLAVVSAATATACAPTPLSALSDAGKDAAEIQLLFWVMTAGALVIWIGMIALIFYCLGGARPGRVDRSRRLIIGGGLLLPTSVLSLLVIWALPQLEARTDGPLEAGDDALRVHVTGEQWWWRVIYERPGGGMVEVANELRLPRGQTTHLSLTSSDVIHAFWVPSLAGKIDMIPGRVTYLTLEPGRTGTFRGLCAEYCGASHARMAFEVEVVEPAAFDLWLATQDEPAVPASAEAEAGAAAFQASGCAGCHAVRGTTAVGTIGPDLTHMASRSLLAAASLPNDDASLAAWIRDPAHVKPGALMPSFAALGNDRVRVLARYLRGLR